VVAVVVAAPTLVLLALECRSLQVSAFWFLLWQSVLR
jgi:hypothetical protein